MSEDYLKKLMNVFSLKPEPAVPTDNPMPENAPSLLEMLGELVKVPDHVWGRYAFSRDILGGKFDTKEMDRLTDLSNDCGRSYAEKFSEQYGSSVPSELAGLLGLEVSYPTVPAGTDRVTFAEFMPPNKIFLYKDCIDKAKELLKDEQLNSMLENLNVEQLLLAHELFHYIEGENDKTIFTRTEKVDLWAPKPFRNRSTIRCLGEIAGMAFAARMLGLSYSPFVMDVFFVFSYSDGFAFRLYDEIMTMAREE